MTLRLDKFQRLARTYGSTSHVISVACSGLADLVETGDVDGEAVHAYLDKTIGAYRGKVDSGAGLHPLPLREEGHPRHALGPVPVFDSTQGTARQLHCRLKRPALTAPRRDRRAA